MRLLRRSAAVIAAALLLAGCGGGGGGTQSTVPAPAASPTAGSASTNRTPVGVAKLTVQYSAHFHTAKIPPKSTSSTSRRPAYVNSNAYYLDVWVVDNNAGTAYHVVDSSSLGQDVTPSADGSQTFSIPLYSTSQNQIVAYEADQSFGNYGNLLSVGESDIGNFTAGTAPQIALTMQMNAQYLGVTSSPDNLNGDALAMPSPFSYHSYNSICSIPASLTPVYFFASDAEGGFVDLAGAGGVVNPTLASWTSDMTAPTNTLAAGSGLSGSYTVTINNTNLGSGTDGVSVHLTATNPAFPLATAAVNNQATYPGLNYLYQNGYDGVLNSYLTNMYNSTPQVLTATIDILPSNGC